MLKYLLPIFLFLFCFNINSFEINVDEFINKVEDRDFGNYLLTDNDMKSFSFDLSVVRSKLDNSYYLLIVNTDKFPIIIYEVIINQHEHVNESWIILKKYSDSSMVKLTDENIVSVTIMTDRGMATYMEETF